MKVKYDEPLSNFAFHFNLRRYTMAKMRTHGRLATDDADVEDTLTVLERRVVLVASGMDAGDVTR